MGVTFHKDMRIAGYRLATIKNTLRSFMQTGSPGSSDRSEIGAHSADRAAGLDGLTSTYSTV